GSWRLRRLMCGKALPFRSQFSDYVRRVQAQPRRGEKGTWAVTESRRVSAHQTAKPHTLPSLTESLPVLDRRDEGPDHLGVYVVAAELFQLLKPEVITRVIRILRVIRVAPQVTKVLHQ